MRFLVPLVVLLPALIVFAATVRRRLRAPSRPFRCTARACRRSDTGARFSAGARLPQSWLPRRCRARWVGETLVLRYGVLRLRRVTLRGRLSVEGVRSLHDRGLTRFGPNPITLQLELVDGSAVEVATSSGARLLLVGPYLAAAIHDLPKAPVPRSEPPEPSR